MTSSESMKTLPIYHKYPIVIPGVTPFRNVLDAFKNVPNFRTLYFSRAKFSINIIQIGAGGTGSYVAPEIVRYLSSLPEDIQKRITYTIIDGDTVEEKNLKRQCFCADDIGRNKAEVLVEQCTSYYGCKAHVQAYPYFITTASQLYNISNCFPTLEISDFFRNDCLQKSFSEINIDEEKVNALNPLLPEDLKYFDVFSGAPHSCAEESFVKTPMTVNYYLNRKYISENETAFPYNDETTAASVAFELSDDLPESSIPILIDCVDKTTVRNLISKMLDTFMYKNNIQQQLYLDTLDSIYYNLRDRHSNNEAAPLFKIAVNEYDSKNTHMYFAPFEFFVLGENKQAKDVDSNSQSKEFIIGDYKTYKRNVLSYYKGDHSWAISSDIPYIYVVSSGNGKYEGQVTWGRYSFMSSHTKPITYKDVWGDELVPGSYIDRNKFEDFEPHKIYYKNEISNRFPDRLKTKKGLNLMLEGETSSNHYSDLTSVYDLGPIKLKESPNKIGKDFTLNLLKSMYSFSRIYSKFMEANPDNVQAQSYSWASPFGYNDPTFYSFNREVATLEVAFRNYNLRPTLALGYMHEHVVTASINSSTGNTLPMDNQYTGFKDWASRYLSVPMPYHVNPGLIDIEEDRKEEQRSCAEHAQDTFEQSIQANKTAANLVFNYVSQILNGILSLHTDNCEEVRLDNAGTYFDIRKNSFTNIPITTQYLSQYEYSPSKDTNALDVIYGFKTVGEVWDLEHPKNVEDMIREISLDDKEVKNA